MARMHSRDKGKSRSRKALNSEKPTWVQHGSKEVEMLVSKLGKEGKTGALIGLHLRDSYGVPSVKQLTKRRIGAILKEKKLTQVFPDDMMNLMKRAVHLRKHQETNHHDMTAKRGLQLTESKILRLAKYYKKKGMIKADWKYSPEELKLIVSE